MSKLAVLLAVPVSLALLSCLPSTDADTTSSTEPDAATESGAGGSTSTDADAGPEAGDEAGGGSGGAAASGGTGGTTAAGGTGGAAATGGTGGTAAGGTAGGASDGGTGGTADGWVSPSCIHTGVTEEACNPVTNYLCTDEQACDFIMGEDFELGFACAHIQATDGNEGDACDNSSGPFCLAGMHCAKTGNAQVCAYMCCSDADCTGIAKKCEPLDAQGVGTFGFCR